MLYRKYWELFTNKTKKYIFLFFFKEIWIEELIQNKKKIKEWRLPINLKRISSILQFYFGGDC